MKNACSRKKTACVFLWQYRINRQESLAKKIRQNPMTHLYGVALRQYRIIWRESLTRGFASEKGGKPPEYFVYFKVFLTPFWRKESVRIRRRNYAVLPKAIPHKSARESDERFFVRKRCKTAGILCVLQGFTNAFPTKKIRQNPKTHLCGVAL